MVGLSGGVDSAAAAAVLCREGHDVIGVTMSIWRDGRYKGGCGDACFGPHEKEDIAAAREICRRLNIPHRVLDCADAYERIVLEDFRREYRAGRTPNPCVRCNAEVKFGELPRLAREAGEEFDFFATGHYARVCRDGGQVSLRTAAAAERDQSYFLYRLRPEQLASFLTPLGGFGKADARKIAAECGLPQADKPDSQDFYSGDYRELLGTEETPGYITDTSGKVLGRHSGYWNFTVGQRKGLGISHPSPLYVVEILPERNEVVAGGRELLRHTRLTAGDANWVSVPPPEEPFEAGIRVRSAGRMIPCRVTPQEGGGFAAEFPEGVTAAVPGQSAVLYQGDILLGGGIISAAG